MKAVYKILLVSLLGIPSLSSCDHFLTCDPESSYTVNGAYKTQDDIQQASLGIYSSLQELFDTSNLLYGLNMRSDELNIVVPGNSYHYLEGIERFINDPLNSISANWFKTLFSVVNNANLILSKLDDATFDDETQREYYRGECYFLRGFAYWYLGHLYGGMPLYDKPYSVEEVKTIARSTQDETFDFAEKDFLAAIQKLPATWTGSNQGRPTKYAADGMLARMDLFRHKYSEAKPLLEDVINSGQYKLATNYVDCVSEAGEYGPERMFEIQYVGGMLGEGQFFTTSCLPEGYSGSLQPFTGFTSCPTVSSNMVSAYESGDLRKDVSVNNNISNGGVVDPRDYYIIKYHHNTNTPGERGDWGVDLPILRYTDVKLMYAEVLNELNGVNSTSISILNEVRTRAGLASLTSFSSKDAFLQALIHERQVEFAFEGLRWEDLIRWGIVEKVINSYLSDVKQDGGTFSMKDYQIILPIPQSVIDSYADDKIMWQNPNY